MIVLLHTDVSITHQCVSSPFVITGFIALWRMSPDMC